MRKTNNNQEGIRVWSVLLFYLFTFLPSLADDISKENMQRIYDEVRTPYKYGLVIAPTDNYHKIDCPTVFREGDKWLMTYVVYNGKDGTDGRGYETWLAESDDLLHWTTKGRILSYKNDGWDMNQRGGFPALIDWTWDGSYGIGTYKGKHWMTYIGGHGTGYEAVREPLHIGMAWTDDDITTAHEWQNSEKPLLSINDKDAQWWEKLTQYKSTIYEVKNEKGKTNNLLPPEIRKHRFVMFYNAGGVNPENNLKAERIGIALSDDLRKWIRYNGNPVFANEVDGIITGDAQIVKMEVTTPDGSPSGSLYVMFYFKAYDPSRKYNAFNTFAASRDLLHWQRWEGEDLIWPTKPYDEMFAHKSYVVKHDGVVYHFYCAVNNEQQRGIAVATSVPLGRSEVRFPEPETKGPRILTSLNEGWTAAIIPDGSPSGVTIPHNFDDYYGYRQLRHGNLHGSAIYQKTFIAQPQKGKRYFLQFEGVGTYATITLNDTQYPKELIGRTVFTLDVTDALNTGKNTLHILVDHPAMQTESPWVCGGCSSEWGFSEGSQPFGIFRPVTLIETDAVRIEPFGVHIWNNAACDSVFIETEIKNYDTNPHTFEFVNKFAEKSGKTVFRVSEGMRLEPGETRVVRHVKPVANVHRWSLEDPYLYTLTTMVKQPDHYDGDANRQHEPALITTDLVSTPFGICSISWPIRNATIPDGSPSGDHRFYLNEQPVFINGVCEYEHEFGQSHAFTNEQIEARIKLVKDAGFNAFRDAHQPHNLYYQKLLDREGILWWPQFSAHIWYDTPEFRTTFKRLLRQWVKERRNSPSLILWGLQNESTLPRDFAEECSDIIREMDPRCGEQRLITTCNGGEGTDWNVVQNWSGTYGGNIDNYANELARQDQLLNGEYGAWRTLGNHTGEGYTEERFCDILAKKVSLAEQARDSVCGQFLWLLTSHENPGRQQPDEALRRVDKVGPINHKGLFSLWDQPTDAFYMYQQRYNPHPVVPATTIVDEGILAPANGWTYLYRLNCGGDDYTDALGNHWMQDNTRWSRSWGDAFATDTTLITSYTASQTFNDSISSVLFKTSRFGRHRLSYHFPAKPGHYRVELYFIEPWYRQHDAEGLRIFDVAINDSIVIRDLDIWAQAYYGQPHKRVIEVDNRGHELCIDFPRVKAGQAMIAAIAIAQVQPTAVPQQETKPALWAAFERDILVKTPDSLLPPQHTSAIEIEGRCLKNRIEWDFNVGVAKVYALRWKYYNPKAPRQLHVTITDTKGVVYKDANVTFLQTQQKQTKRKMTSITTGSQVNAGKYKVVLTGDGLNDMIFDNLTIE